MCYTFCRIPRYSDQNQIFDPFIFCDRDCEPFNSVMLSSKESIDAIPSRRGVANTPTTTTTRSSRHTALMLYLVTHATSSL